MTAHLYETMLPSPRLVWAGRMLVDLIVGDAPTEDILQIGGTRNFGAFGGQTYSPNKARFVVTLTKTL